MVQGEDAGLDAIKNRHQKVTVCIAITVDAASDTRTSH